MFLQKENPAVCAPHSVILGLQSRFLIPLPVCDSKGAPYGEWNPRNAECRICSVGGKQKLGSKACALKAGVV